MKYQEPITTHHKIPESWGGYLQSGNTIQLKEKVHRALHTLFQDDTPLQRIRRSLEIDKSTLHPDIYAEIDKVLAVYEKMEIQIYNPLLFNSDKFLRKGKH